jgi:ubiquinone/menaquinone biosynthesis C-methylase UbiE
MRLGFPGDELNLPIEERDRQMLVPDNQDTQMSESAFTGERFLPRQTDPLLALEHYHRYCFASRFAKNRRVLDVACGEGYGSACLAQWADEVVGIDIDPTTIEHANRKYAAVQNLAFKVGRCEAINEDRESFDLVVSYETIEHLEEDSQDELLKSVRRILRQDGLFIVSSPEKNEYAAIPQSHNQFHKYEMTLFELKSRLEAYFKYVHLCAQRVLSLSTMWHMNGWQDAQFRFYAKRDLLKEIPRGEPFSPPLYLIALCSNRPISDDAVAEANSFYFDLANVEKTKYLYEWARSLESEVRESREAVHRLEKQLEERTSWNVNLQSEIKGHTEYIHLLKKELEERTQWARSLESEVATERAHYDRLNEKLSETNQKLNDITGRLTGIASSFVYRLLAKIRLLPDAWGPK